jgi:hypothetical protein
MALQSFSQIYWRFSWGFREFVTVSGGESVKDGLDVERVHFVETGVDLVVHHQPGGRTVTVRRVASLGACPVRALKDWMEATAKRRLASLTDASTTALSPQKADDSQSATSPFIRGFSPPVTLGQRRASSARYRRDPPDPGAAWSGAPSSRNYRMRRSAANAAATADALLAWLGTQTRSGAAAAPSESDGHPEGAVSVQDSAGGNGVADALTHYVPVTAPAAGASAIATRPTERTEAERRATSMRLAHTDWLHHRLAIIGMAEQLAAFRRAATGAGVIPWQLDLDRMEEDLFHLLAAPSTQPRTLSVAGARVLAGQLRKAVDRRHERAVARVGASQACPFDLHALIPVPDEILRLGPDDPVTLAWLWEHWGTTQPLRHVAVDVVASQEARRGSVLAAEQDTVHVTFWSADWTPWRALAALAERWSGLRFDARPTYGGS